VVADTPYPHTTLNQNFTVLCLRKPKPLVVINAATCSSACEVRSPSLTYGEVVDELDSERWSFAPYPRCDRDQLLQVHAYWLAVPTESKSMDTLPPLRNVSGARDVHALAPKQQPADDGAKTFAAGSAREEGPAPRFCCVVGVVWVRLSTSGRKTHNSRVAGRTPARATTTSATTEGGAVEGYLQVVLTHPNYRRRGLASWLLRECLATTEAPANVFVSDTNSTAPYVIRRWHLHTLKAPPAASRVRQRCVETPSHERCLAKGEGDERNDETALLRAALSMYQRLGFTERRYLYRYYAGMRDAVELIKQC
jgi:ribosomal protein S18 acetylase RimI-like enzyme